MRTKEATGHERRSDEDMTQGSLHGMNERVGEYGKWLARTRE